MKASTVSSSMLRVSATSMHQGLVKGTVYPSVRIGSSSRSIAVSVASPVEIGTQEMPVFEVRNARWAHKEGHAETVSIVCQ